MPAAGSGTRRGDSKSNQGTSGANMSGGGMGGTGQGGAGGQSPSLLDSKYPGARGKKVKQRDLNASNMAKVATILGGLVGGPAATAVGAGYSALTGDLSVEGMLDPFSGQGLPDVPSVGAGYADSGKKADTVTGLVASKKKKTSKPTNPLGSVGTILSGAGGSLVQGGL